MLVVPVVVVSLDHPLQQPLQVKSYLAEAEAEEPEEHLVVAVAAVLLSGPVDMEGQEGQGGQEGQEEELLLCMEVQELHYPIAEQLL